MDLNRRQLLQLLSATTFTLSLPRVAPAARAAPDTAAAVHFPQGVASADPQPDAVMLWTRAEPRAEAAQVELVLQLSPHEDFTEIVLQESLTTSAASDYTVRAYVQGLQPDTTYYYRFLGGGQAVSRRGRTRTAPAPGQAVDTRVAFVSCQNYEDAFFGSWARMLEDDLQVPENEQIQFVLHLGDFIYERLWPRALGGGPHPRSLPPLPDGAADGERRHALTLADYRHLYRAYLGDPHLQAARARWPFVCTWDDHEFSNDNFQSYSNYGAEPLLEPQRKRDANQAWFEFVPSVLGQLAGEPAHDFIADPVDTEDGDSANRAARDSLCIYRRLRWGSRLDILLTDTRSYRSPPCLEEGFAASLGLPMNPVGLVEIADAGRDYGAGTPPEFLPYGGGDTPNPAREREPGSCLGADQRNWFLHRLKTSTATWKLWGNALPLLPMRVDLSALPFTDHEDAIFNLDAWAGYPHEVRLLMQAIHEAGVTGVVSLSGDHHMHGAGTVRPSANEPDSAPVIADFTVAGISSSPLFPQLELVAREEYPDFAQLVYRDEDGKILPLWNMTMLHGALAAAVCARTGLRRPASWLGPNRANPGLAYVDTNANGYGIADFRGEELRVQMVTISDVAHPPQPAPEPAHIAHFRLPRWRVEDGPQLEGPDFEGGAPFPFAGPTV